MDAKLLTANLKSVRKNSLFVSFGRIYRKGEYDRRLKGYIVYTANKHDGLFDVECGFMSSHALVDILIIK